MRIPSFEVRDQRSLVFAACAAVPNLMVITGPNGAGKVRRSDMHSGIQVTPENILYVGPHRASRRQNVQQLITRPLLIEEMLAPR